MCKRKIIKLKLLILILAIVIIFVFCTMLFQGVIKRVVYTYCDALVSNLGVESINESTARVVEMYNYADFIKIERDLKDEIVMIETDSVLANSFARTLALYCESDLAKVGVQEIKVPIGAFTGAVLLSNSGPKVSVKITFFSSVKCDFFTTFESVGINQTLHSLYVKIDVWFNTVLPISEHELRLTNNVLIGENVIIGRIPDVYVNSEDGTNYLDLVP